jgi:hypothetical protein
MAMHTLFFACLVILEACQTPPLARLPAATTSVLAAPPGQATHYLIRSDLSDVRLLVYRAGPLAARGHNHVVQATTVTGDIALAPDFQRSNFSIVMPVAGFLVDAPDARRVEGEEFAKLPAAEFIEGTTRNMLASTVLDATRFPQIEIRTVKVIGPSWAPDCTIRIRLKAVERDITVPVVIDYADDRLVATAVFEVKQTDFGISPLSILGGALQVADAIRVRMRIVAQKA